MNPCLNTSLVKHENTGSCGNRVILTPLAGGMSYTPKAFASPTGTGSAGPLTDVGGMSYI